MWTILVTFLITVFQIVQSQQFSHKIKSEKKLIGFFSSYLQIKQILSLFSKNASTTIWILVDFTIGYAQYVCKAALYWSHVFNHLFNFSETLRIDFKNSNNSLKSNLTAVFAAESKLYGVEMRR